VNQEVDIQRGAEQLLGQALYFLLSGSIAAAGARPRFVGLANRSTSQHRDSVGQVLGGSISATPVKASTQTRSSKRGVPRSRAAVCAGVRYCEASIGGPEPPTGIAREQVDIHKCGVVEHVVDGIVDPALRLLSPTTKLLTELVRVKSFSWIVPALSSACMPEPPPPNRPATWPSDETSRLASLISDIRPDAPCGVAPCHQFVARFTRR